MAVSFPSLVLSSNFDYGDSEKLREFMLEHAVKHGDYATAISKIYNKNMPLFDVFDDLMTLELGKMMNEPESKRQSTISIESWVEAHATLHQAELSATTIAQNYSIRSVDFTQEDQFYDWMQYHAYLHDIEDAVIGASL